MTLQGSGHSRQNSPDRPHDRVWVVHPWRLIPPLLVLVTVAVIWATRLDQLVNNHWAYPATLLLCGLVALILVLRARPRKVQRPLPYPD